MNRNYINIYEIDKSIDILNGYFNEEKKLLNSIVTSLVDGFDSYYKTDNLNRIVSHCSNLNYYSTVLANNRVKYVNILINARNAYKSAATYSSRIIRRGENINGSTR